MVLFGLGVYSGIAVLGYFMSTNVHFVALGVLVAMVQGGTQGLSRSLFASMIPVHKSGEFFALFAVGEKFAGIFGPLIFGVVIEVTGLVPRPPSSPWWCSSWSAPGSSPSSTSRPGAGRHATPRASWSLASTR